MSKTSDPFIRWFKDITLKDIPQVGGKNASLGELVRELGSESILVPEGFAVTADAYLYFLEEADLRQKIVEHLSGLNVSDVADLQRRGKAIREAILSAELPGELRTKILAAYRELVRAKGSGLAVAVRSSATAEDLPEASFAGQQETFLNVQGEATLIESCRRCYASLFTDRAITYRENMKFNHLDVALSIGIQEMVRSDLASAGVMFTIDTDTGFENVVLINANYGLGESVVQGAVNPDEYYVFKPTLLKGFRPILQKKLGTKDFKVVYDEEGTKLVKNVAVSSEDKTRFCLSDEEILSLARWGAKIEEHYSKRHSRKTPMDIEWAKDGITGKLYIVQARPETVEARKEHSEIVKYTLEKPGRVLVRGNAITDKIGSGKARVVASAAELSDFKPGEVLVAVRTDPDWEPAMKKASAIVTNRGGRTCHAAIISRELGVPAVIGTNSATELIKTGDDITVSCAGSNGGFVYEGILPFSTEKTPIKDIPQTNTKIMLNISEPGSAFKLSFLPNSGVGLARIEFIVSSQIKVHPLALIHYKSVVDAAEKAKIDALTQGFKDKPQYFVDGLAQGVAMIAAAFYPKDVIVRFSDFKTNEYRDLIGGAPFEPKEENPMLGFRGASRYYSPEYRDAFALECRALKKVRDEMGLTNVKLMIPFCRTVEEGKLVLAELAKNGLIQGENGLEVYVMCEIPSNVILAHEFAQIFDGFSIGSNDLTQLILGVDRESESVAHVFDERNPAIKKMIEQVIYEAKTAGKKIGICGQAPSDYPEFARFLVENRIDSMSLNPDAVLKTIMLVAKTEASPD